MPRLAPRCQCAVSAWRFFTSSQKRSFSHIRNSASMWHSRRSITSSWQGRKEAKQYYIIAIARSSPMTSLRLTCIATAAKAKLQYHLIVWNSMTQRPAIFGKLHATLQNACIHPPQHLHASDSLPISSNDFFKHICYIKNKIFLTYTP